MPKTATLWLPAWFWNGDQKKGWPRRPMSSTCGIGPPMCSPCKGAIEAAVVVSMVLKRFMRLRSAVSPLGSESGMAARSPMTWR